MVAGRSKGSQKPAGRIPLSRVVLAARPAIDGKSMDVKNRLLTGADTASDSRF